MSENRCRDFSKYDAMTTEELEDILRLDSEAPQEQESDTELILYVMGVLAERSNSTGNTGKTALEAWESFQQNYLSEVHEPLEYIPEKKSAKVMAPWVRRAIAVAAVITLVVCIPVTARAFGWEDLWEIFARWAQETFSFVSGADTEVSEPDLVSEEGYTSLQDALAKSNRDPSIVPSWIPDGYVLEQIEKDISPVRETYYALYSNGEQPLTIFIQSFLTSDSENIEIDDTLIQIYESNGVEYYIFLNMDQIRAVWTIDSYECYISGELPIEEMKTMIDSIRKG